MKHLIGAIGQQAFPAPLGALSYFNQVKYLGSCAFFVLALFPYCAFSCLVCIHKPLFCAFFCIPCIHKPLVFYRTVSVLVLLFFLLSDKLSVKVKGEWS